MNKPTYIHAFSHHVSEHTFEQLHTQYNMKSVVSGQKFFYLLTSGFAKNQDIQVSVTSVLPVNSTDQRKIFWHFDSEVENGVVFNYVPLVNLPILRKFTEWSIYFF